MPMPAMGSPTELSVCEILTHFTWAIEQVAWIWAEPLNCSAALVKSCRDCKCRCWSEAWWTKSAQAQQKALGSQHPLSKSSGVLLGQPASQKLRSMILSPCRRVSSCIPLVRKAGRAKQGEPIWLPAYRDALGWSHPGAELTAPFLNHSCPKQQLSNTTEVISLTGSELALHPNIHGLSATWINHPQAVGSWLCNT